MSKDNVIQRWSTLDRVTHLLILIGVVTAIITGLPELRLYIFGFDLGSLFRWITGAIGGESIRRILHRYVVTGSIGLAIILHGISFTLRKKRSHILLTTRDIKDLIAYYKHKFFGAPEPTLGFHMPGEKLLYWVAAICLPVLGFTGLMMWTRTLWIEYELLRLIHRIAFLVLSILVLIHFILNISMRDQWPALKAMYLTGKVPKKWIEEHHPLAIKEEQPITMTGRRKVFGTLLCLLWTIVFGYGLKTLLNPPSFKLENLSVEPDKVEVGKPINVSVEVTNVGYRAGKYLLQLMVDGVPVSEKEVDLLDGETALVSFQTTIEKEGLHEISVNGISKQVEVTKLPPSLPSIKPELAKKFKELLPKAASFTPVLKDGKVVYYEAYDSAGNLIAYAFYAKVYAPTDKLQIFGIIDLNYRISVVDIDRLKPGTHLRNEKIIEPEFESEFTGLTIEDLKLAPEGKVDAVSGATLSSDLIVRAIRKVLKQIQSTS